MYQINVVKRKSKKQRKYTSKVPQNCCDMLPEIPSLIQTSRRRMLRSCAPPMLGGQSSDSNVFMCVVSEHGSNMGAMHVIAIDVSTKIPHYRLHVSQN